MRTLTICSVLFVLAPFDIAYGQAVAAQTARSSAPALQGFSVVLVLGDLQAGAASDNMPPAARAALADMKDFLPYKGYRLIDTAWILGEYSRPLTSRLRGVDDQDFEVNITASVAQTTPSGGVRVTFRLREPSDSNIETAQLRRQQQLALEATRQALAMELAASREKLSAKHPDVVRLQQQLAVVDQRVATEQRQSRGLPGGPALIDTGFTMNIGETVVVGTSRVRGDKALIALLTAVPRAQ